MPKINTQIIEDYIDLQNNLKNLTSERGITIAHVCRQTGIPRTTFERKLKAQSFYPKELKRIAEIINS